MTISGENRKTGHAAQLIPSAPIEITDNLYIRTNLQGVNTLNTQANKSEQNIFEFAENSVSKHRHTTQANLYRFALQTASSNATGNVCNAVILFAQNALGHRYTATSLPNLQIGNARVGSGDRLTLEGIGDSIRNTLADFYLQIRQQLEVQNKTLNGCFMTSTMLKMSH